ncbi:MAG TPA: GNAT family N-acetyltransferase [Solirubrobacterales bacterium]|nr:GNAT family N-acetyltransferase [Solirubrobacterales bacterium]
MLHHHHQAVAPETGAFTDDHSSWEVRSASYREWLADPRSFVLIAREAERPVGYAVARVMETGPDWRDSWQMPPTMAEVETLVVLPALRNSGLGTRLLDAVEDELERQGITEVIVGIIPGNGGAQRLYERRGFRPRWVVLSRSGA